MKEIKPRFTVVLLSVLFMAYTQIGYAESLQTDSGNDYNIQIDDGKNITKLQEIVVTATKTSHTLEDVPVETVVITNAEIEKSNAQNIMDVLKEVPGLSVANHSDVFGTYTWHSAMRGLDFDSGYGLVLIDGQRAMGCGQSGGMGEYGIGLNQIPVNMIERIEVVKGPGSALYGSDAMAGVINIITKKTPNKPTGWAGGSYGWYKVKRKVAGSSEENVGGKRNMSQAYFGFGDRITDSTSYLISYNYEGADDITVDPLASDRNSFLGKLDTSITEDINLFTKVELSDYEKTDSREETSHRVSIGGDWRVAEDHILSVKGYTYKWDFVHGYPGYEHGYKDGYVTFNQSELLYTWHMTKNNILSAGGEYQAQKIDFMIENQDGSIVNVDENVRTKSCFLQDELSFWDRVTLIGGARYDDHSVFGDEVNPKFSFMVRLMESSILRGSVGRSFKSPTIRQLYYDAPYRHGGWYAQSNPELKPEKAVGYTIGLEQRLLEDNLIFNLGYFRNDVKDMVVSVDTGTLYNGLPLVKYENVEKAWTQGIELMGNAYLGRAFDVSLSYTYTKTENKESGKELTYIPKHSISLRTGYEWDSLGLGARTGVTYTGRQYTDSDNTTRISDYTTVEAKIYKYLSKRSKISFEADDIFDSTKSSENSYYAGRTFIVKMSLEF
ncbi:MAG: TonB-dependent receptor [Pseudomonadota bacterium]